MVLAMRVYVLHLARQEPWLEAFYKSDAFDWADTKKQKAGKPLRGIQSKREYFSKIKNLTVPRM